MVLCREFGWTPAELDEQDAGEMMLFVRMMGIEAQLQEAGLRRSPGGRR